MERNGRQTVWVLEWWDDEQGLKCIVGVFTTQEQSRTYAEAMAGCCLVWQYDRNSSAYIGEEQGNEEPGLGSCFYLSEFTLDKSVGELR